MAQVDLSATGRLSAQSPSLATLSGWLQTDTPKRRRRCCGPSFATTSTISFSIGISPSPSNTLHIWAVLTSRHRNETGFDLWEEVSGASFFTTISQYRALVEGSALAAELRTTCGACDAVAPHILCFIQSYWSDEGYIISNSKSGPTPDPNLSWQRSAKDGTKPIQTPPAAERTVTASSAQYTLLTPAWAATRRPSSPAATAPSRTTRP